MQDVRREEWFVEGIVQGVGFRPFVFRLAREAGLTGLVRNASDGVVIELEGDERAFRVFESKWETGLPPLARVQRISKKSLAVVHSASFQIVKSDPVSKTRTRIPADIAMCADCRRDIFDPADRHYRYPFTNCSHCGPRYSVIEGMPYDRAQTTMKPFEMCADCAREYSDPADRRFHAQPVACPACGPQLELWDPLGRTLARGDEALRTAVRRLCDGSIVAVKGIGGFHLMADATSASAVELLRHRKERGNKPFAVMFADGEQVRAMGGRMDEMEARALSSPEAPIVLLEKEPARASVLAPSVAPRSRLLGAMLAYSPLHALVLEGCRRPLVATSANVSEEPICVDEKEALERLQGIADFFLVHDRRIVRSVEDSVVRAMDGRRIVLRRSRGFAPLSIELGVDGPSVLAVGGHLKNALAIRRESEVFVSAHNGDLSNRRAMDAFEKTAADLPELLGIDPASVSCDLHPDYASTRFARASGFPVVGIQHHVAHVFAVMAEHRLKPPVFGVAFDGTGYGTDGTVWGGEFFFVGENSSAARVGSLRLFSLLGGETAVVEPWRCALGLRFEIEGKSVFDSEAWKKRFEGRLVQERALKQWLSRGQFVRTSSMGRLFDGVAGLLGLCERQSFEAEAASLLEGEAMRYAGEKTLENDSERYEMELLFQGEGNKRSFVADWEPMVRGVLEDVQAGVPAPRIARSFHVALSRAIVEAALEMRCPDVVLSGGCFANRVLLEESARRLRHDGFRVHYGVLVPSGDGGLCVGQAFGAANQWGVTDRVSRHSGKD